jgi:nucleotide-binding universal stress UspA family protein
MATVVCGIERSEDAHVAGQVAAVLARRLDSRLELVHVSVPGAAPAAHLIGTAMHAVRDRIAIDDISVQVVSGDPVERLLAAAADSRLLVLGSREGGAIRQVRFGSVTESGCRASPVPVGVVPPGASVVEGDAVVLGVRDDRDEPCARMAGGVAAALGMALVLVHVNVPPTVGGYLAAPDAAPLIASQVDEGARHAGRMVRELAETLASEHVAPAAVRVVSGPPGPELERVAEDERAALVAVGAPHRGTLAAALGGASSRHVIRHSGRPVMVCPHG